MKLIFDFDGTLHKSECTYIPAFHKVHTYLAQHGLAPAHEMGDDEIGFWLGYNSKEMWDRYAPNLSQEEKDRCAKILGDEMLRLAQAGKARLYPGVEDALARLKDEGHTLVFFSNCHHDYQDVHVRAFGLERFFDSFFCGEDLSWKSKTEGFADICAHYGMTGDLEHEFVVVGDRFHDMAIASDHGLVAVGCAYGYGTRDELEDAAVIAESPERLYDAVERAIALAGSQDGESTIAR